MGTVVMWLFLIATVFVIIGTLLYMKYQQKKTGANNNISKVRDKKTKKANVRDVWEIQDIKQGVIKLANYEYRMVMRLAAADFFLLGETEQTQVEDSLIGVLMGLSFPVQFLVTSEAVDTRQSVQEVKEKIFGLHESIRRYAQEYAIYLDGLTSERTAASRNAYVVVPFQTDKGIEYARTELTARASMLADGLRNAKIHSEMLDTAGLVDLLHHLFNRNSSWRPSEADMSGVMESYIISKRQVDDGVA